MTSQRALERVLEQLAAPALEYGPDWADVLARTGTKPAGEPTTSVVDGARRDVVECPPALGGRRKRRRALIAAVAVGVAAAGIGVGVAATGDILDGPAAPPKYDDALRTLFPPLEIGRARRLASHEGRTLFGARTRGGGYCFSSTSATDPGAEGGHCVSDAEARLLDRRRFVAFAMSGSSVGGFAPTATEVRVVGAGLDVRIPVSASGWWVGEARLATPPLPQGVDQATVTAVGYSSAGAVTGREPLLHIRRSGEAFVIAFA